MGWKFDQPPNVACITCASVIKGHPVLLATHYEDDHSWAFMDRGPVDPASALVVAMSEIVDRHPDLAEIANLSPGWSATRTAVGEPWMVQQGDCTIE